MRLTGFDGKPISVCSDSIPGSCAHWRARAGLVRDAFSSAYAAYEVPLAAQNGALGL